MNPKVWEASSHVEGFNDPMIDDKQSKKRYRADMLIEQHILKLRQKGDQDRADELQQKLDTSGTRKGLCEDLYDIIMEEEIRSDRKSTRLNSSHVATSYAVFCLKKKNTKNSLTK